MSYDMLLRAIMKWLKTKLAHEIFKVQCGFTKILNKEYYKNHLKYNM